MVTRASGASRKPTIRDVARHAGVSHGTVSRVLNGGMFVSEEARRKVEAAIAETGYVVSYSARSLATGRAGSIGFLLTEPQQLLFEDANFSTLYRAAAQALAARDLPLVLMVAATPAERTQVMRYIAGGHVDGVMLVSSHAGNPVVESLLTAGVPTIACGVPLGYEDRMGYVAADDRRGAKEMTLHLREQGAACIGMVSGPADTSGGRERHAGFLDAVGQDYDPSLIVHGDYTRAGGYRAMRALLDERPEIDGVFVASDLMAMGAIEMLKDRGRRVPDDVLVGGFDDSTYACESEPSLTTMKQPFTRISEEMTRLLLGLIDGQEPAAVVLPTTLIQRDSTTPQPDAPHRA